MIADDTPAMPDGARMVMRCDRLGCAQVVDVDVQATGPELDAHVAVTTVALAELLGWLVEGAVVFCPACTSIRAASRTQRPSTPGDPTP